MTPKGNLKQVVENMLTAAINAEAHWSVFQQIQRHAPQLAPSPVRFAAVLADRAHLSVAFLGATKLFDEWSGRYVQASFAELLKRVSAAPAVHPQAVKIGAIEAIGLSSDSDIRPPTVATAFAAKYGQAVASQDFRTALTRLRKARDKFIAHSEIIWPDTVTFGKTDFRTVMDVAEDFIGLALRLYFGVNESDFHVYARRAAEQMDEWISAALSASPEEP